MQIKTTLRFHLIPFIMAQVTAEAGEDMEKEEHYFIVGGIVSLYNTLKISLVVPQKIGHSTT